MKRDIRKKKMIQIKHEQKERERAQKMEKNDIFNKFMLNDEEIWNWNFEEKETFKDDESETDLETVMQRKIERIRWELLYTLPSVKKAELFCN